MTEIATSAEAETAIAQVAGLIDKLSGVIAEETALVHAGQVRKATALGLVKNELAGQLFARAERLRVNAKFLLRTAPAAAAALNRGQEMFRAVLQKNMIVLATSHAVSEGIVRRLSGDLARKAAPQIYGATGRATVPNPKHGKPLAISKVL
jgi:NAD(P)H-hydrate repair Nnr-like enzyme with NAD(P)H-hydrate dehydratase domain